MTATYDPALIERLVANVSPRHRAGGDLGLTQAGELADQLEAAKREVERTAAERDNARWADETRKKTVAVIIAERDALRDQLAAPRECPVCHACETHDVPAKVDALRSDLADRDASIVQLIAQRDEDRRRIAALERDLAEANAALEKQDHDTDQILDRMVLLEASLREACNWITDRTDNGSDFTDRLRAIADSDVTTKETA